MLVSKLMGTPASNFLLLAGIPRAALPHIPHSPRLLAQAKLPSQLQALQLQQASPPSRLPQPPPGPMHAAHSPLYTPAPRPPHLRALNFLLTRCTLKTRTEGGSRALSRPASARPSGSESQLG